MVFHTPSRLTPIISDQVSSGSSQVRPNERIPALATRTSSLPNRSIAARTAARSAARSLTSARAVRQARPSFATSSAVFARSSSRPRS